MTQYIEKMMTKRELARVLSEIAFFLRLQQGNPYKSVAYKRAARAILVSLHEPQQLLEGHTLRDIPNIGPGTAAVIRELLLTGHSSLHQRLKGCYPASLVELGRVPGLRPKQIRRLYDEAGIRSVADLEDACHKNQLLALKGIGPKLQAKMQTALGEFRRGQGYRLYASVLEEALMLEKNLAAIRGVTRVAMSGTLRRKMEVINAFHFVVTWSEDQGTAAFLKAFKAIPNITDVTMIEPRQMTAMSPTGMPITITLARSTDQNFHLLRATGSDEHLTQLLERLLGKGFPYLGGD